MTFDEALRKMGFDSIFFSDEEVDAEDGGPGSGNWGHAGRIGKHGGSAKNSGGKALRYGSSPAEYEGVKKKVEHFRTATTKANKTFSYARWNRSLTKDEHKAIADQHATIAKVTGSTETVE